MFAFLKNFFGFGQDYTKLDISNPGEEVKPLEYTSTYEEPVPIVFEEEKVEEEEENSAGLV